MKELGIELADGHVINTNLGGARPAADFAEEVYRAYRENGGDFGLIAVDTIGPFVQCGDWNDYAGVGQVMSPLRELARALPSAGLLLLHHEKKSGGEGWGGALGSTALTGCADQIVRLCRKNQDLSLAFGGRYNPNPFPFDEPVSIVLENGQVELLGTVVDTTPARLLDSLPPDPSSVKDIMEAMGDRNPGRRAVDRAIRGLVKDGRMVLVQAAKGNRPGLYQAGGESAPETA